MSTSVAPIHEMVPAFLCGVGSGAAASAAAGRACVRVGVGRCCGLGHASCTRPVARVPACPKLGLQRPLSCKVRRPGPVAAAALSASSQSQARTARARLPFLPLPLPPFPLPLALASPRLASSSLSSPVSTNTLLRPSQRLLSLPAHHLTSSSGKCLYLDAHMAKSSPCVLVLCTRFFDVSPSHTTIDLHCQICALNSYFLTTLHPKPLAK